MGYIIVGFMLIPTVLIIGYLFAMNQCDPKNDPDYYKDKD